MRHAPALLLAVLLTSAVAVGQAVIGNMYQLGQSTGANLPAIFDGGIKGAMLFDLDAGVPKFNDGTTWQEYGSGSSSAASFWVDAGTFAGSPATGFIYAPETLRRPDGGYALALFVQPSSAFPQTKPGEALRVAGIEETFANDWVGIQFARDIAVPGARRGNISTATTGSIVSGSAHYAGMTLVGSGGVVGFASDDWGYLIAKFDGSGAAGTGRLVFETTADNDAFRLTTGARAHVGGGTDDYFASDAGAIYTPARIASNNPLPVTLVFIHSAIVAATTYSLEPGPPVPFRIDAVRFTITATGAGGSTNATFRASDGANNCDCAFACNTAGNTGYRVACTGTCASFAASAAMTYSVTSIGDCVTGPLILGNLNVEGRTR